MTAQIIQIRRSGDCAELPSVVHNQEFCLKLCVALGLTLRQATDYLVFMGMLDL